MTSPHLPGTSPGDLAKASDLTSPPPPVFRRGGGRGREADESGTSNRDALRGGRDRLVALDLAEARRLLELARRAGPRTVADLDLLSNLSLLVLTAERKAVR